MSVLKHLKLLYAFDPVHLFSPSLGLFSGVTNTDTAFFIILFFR
jgi:hypothetical protein